MITNTNMLTDFRKNYDTHIVTFDSWKVKVDDNLTNIDNSAKAIRTDIANNAKLIASLESKLESANQTIDSLKADLELTKAADLARDEKILNLENKFKTLTDQFEAHKVENANKVKAEIKAHLNEKALPFELKSRIDEHEKMATIRGISRDSFNADASNMGIMLNFMEKELKMNEREIDRHHPAHITFNNRGNQDDNTFLVAHFSTRETRNYILSKSRYITNKDILVLASLPLEYRKTHQNFRAKMKDIREQFRVNGNELNTKYEFNEDCSYSCSYRIRSTTGGYEWNILDSFTPTEIIRNYRTKENLKQTPHPQNLGKKLIKILSKERNQDKTVLEQAINAALTSFAHEKSISFNGGNGYIAINPENLDEALNLAKKNMAHHDVSQC